MTREDAIKVLRTESVEIGGNAVSVARWLTALDMAISALQQRSKENDHAICGTTNLPCIRCNPGGCDNRKEGAD